MGNEMKPARDWCDELRDVVVPPSLELIEGRAGSLTLRSGSVFLHSRYQPQEEAQRLIDAAELDPTRPVLVLGTGLGYHVLELLRRGMTVAAVEPDAAVARLAVEGPLKHCDVPLAVGIPEALTADDAFLSFAARVPQMLVHPPTAKLHPEWVEAMSTRAAVLALRRQRLSIAVVGPIYGGSLPIAQFLHRAFRRLGHRALFVDNSLAWDLFNTAGATVKTKHAAAQLTGMLVNFLGEWSYARVAEFAPDICIAIAQAPLNKQFPARLRKEGIATAFWYVENWRHLPYWREIAPHYDWFFHIQPGEFEAQLEDAGCPNHAFVQTGCDPEIHRPVELTPEERLEYGCDLSFAGAGYYNRAQFFKGLTDYNFKIWGVEWDGRELQPLLRRPEERFSPEQFAKIVAGSKINLNLHSSTTVAGVDAGCDAINPRVFEIAAAGGFQLCDPCKGLEDHFDFGHELPVYRDLAELRRKIDYYLEHEDERRKTAERARQRALKEHTYEHRAQRMLDLMLETGGVAMLRRGIRVQRSVGEVAERLEHDSALRTFLSTLPSDLPFTQETINERLTPGRAGMSEPESIFMYLREVRKTVESLLALADK